MATVIHRITGELLESVNTPDYSAEQWLVNPDLSAVADVPRKFWKVVGEAVVGMDDTEQLAVLTAEVTAAKVRRAEEITAQALAAFQARYPLWSQTLFLGIQVAAIAAGRVNQAIYCAQVTQFAGAALQAAAVAHAAIAAADSLEAVAAVTLSLEWLSADPQTSVIVASQMGD